MDNSALPLLLLYYNLVLVINPIARWEERIRARARPLLYSPELPLAFTRTCYILGSSLAFSSDVPLDRRFVGSQPRETYQPPKLDLRHDRQPPHSQQKAIPKVIPKFIAHVRGTKRSDVLQKARSYASP